MLAARETRLATWHARIPARPATARCGAELSDRLPILRHGDPEVIPSPLGCHNRYRAEIEAVVHGTDRATTLAAVFASIGAVRVCRLRWGPWHPAIPSRPRGPWRISRRGPASRSATATRQGTLRPVTTLRPKSRIPGRLGRTGLCCAAEEAPWPEGRRPVAGERTGAALPSAHVKDAPRRLCGLRRAPRANLAAVGQRPGRDGRGRPWMASARVPVMQAGPSSGSTHRRTMSP